MQQVIIITGASSGFGKATAELLASKGHIIYGLCRRRVPAVGNIKYCQCDVRNREQIASVVEDIVKEQGRTTPVWASAVPWSWPQRRR